MNKKPDPEMIDDENPEWTNEDFRTAMSFSELGYFEEHEGVAGQVRMQYTF